jgi:hypothetical protein
MTVYENLIRLKQTKLLVCTIKNGILSPIYLDYLKIYEDYLKMRSHNVSKMQAYTNISEDYSVSETTVRKIIRLLSQ